MRIVFMGSPDFAVPCLETLLATDEIVAVVCQPDKPAGRGQKLTPPPVKERALAAGLRVMQPASVRKPPFLDELRALGADLAVVVAYGKILPPEVLAAPKHGCLNVHASLLPKFRGAAPIQWAIIRGERETGVTLMQMDVGMDTGDMLGKRTLAIDEWVTAG
jgi:methionyl-tRNA formyltransferase